LKLLGKQPGADLLSVYGLTRERGYSVSDRETNAGATSIGAPVIEADGHACAAVVVIGPWERLAAFGHERIGKLVAHAAHTLSRGVITADYR